MIKKLEIIWKHLLSRIKELSLLLFVFWIFTLIAFFTSVGTIQLDLFVLNTIVLLLQIISFYQFRKFKRIYTNKRIIFNIADIFISLFTIFTISYTLVISGLPSFKISVITYPLFIMTIFFSAEKGSIKFVILSTLASLTTYFTLFMIIQPADEFFKIYYYEFMSLLLIGIVIALLFNKTNKRIEKNKSLSFSISDSGTNSIKIIKFELDDFFTISKINSNLSSDGKLRLSYLNKHIEKLLIKHFDIKDIPFTEIVELADLSFGIRYAYCFTNINQDGTISGTLIDISERERAFRELDTMEKQLFQYKKMESLSTMASGMAHDFNNILQTISDIIDKIIEDSDKPDKVKHSAMLVSDAMTDARFLVSELLAVGRKKPLDVEPVNICDFTKNVSEYYSELMGEKFHINLNIPDTPLWINGNRDYLKRIFQNLFGNARDAMPDEGLIKITLTACKENGDYDFIRIIFADTGVGIPEKIVDKIFDPFITTKKKGKGTGLGLAFVKRVTTLHKGDIRIGRTGSQGTEFVMEFPQVIPEISEKVDTKAILLSRKSARIIIVDDEPKIRKILKFFLLDLSYYVFEADSGNAALSELNRDNHYDMIIMDWRIGSEDPIKLIKKIRCINENIIIFVISGYPPKDDIVEKNHIEKWITKPYDKNRLDVEIQKAIFTGNNREEV